MCANNRKSYSIFSYSCVNATFMYYYNYYTKLLNVKCDGYLCDYLFHFK